MRLATPAIRYHQGTREMYISVASAGDVVNITRAPKDWDPLASQPHGNRPIDKAHARGIAAYLEQEVDPVVGAFVLYCQPDDVEFVPYAESDATDLITPGELRLKPSATYDVGDGLHRRFAEERVIDRHRDQSDDVLERLMSLGQPFILIPEGDGRRRAQDYADLQVNVKPPSGSLGMSMDRRQAFNRLMIDAVVQHPNIPLLGGGKRVEFHSDSPGKTSTKWLSFKTLRYMCGTLLIGVDQRTGPGWSQAVNTAVAGDRWENAVDIISDFFNGVAKISPLSDVVAGDTTMAELRETTLLASGVVMYSIAYACSLARERAGVGAADALVKIRQNVTFARPERIPTDHEPLTEAELSDFALGLIDPESGKIGTGREVWERSGRKLFRVIVGDEAYLENFPA